MSKNVFRSFEVQTMEDKVFIQAPQRASQPAPKVVEQLEEVEEYSGPSADDLRREAELFKAGWDKEKAVMVAAAQAEADTITRNAEKHAFEEIKRQKEAGALLLVQAEAQAGRIAEESAAKAAQFDAAAQKKAAQLEQEARERGFTEGKEKGWAEGKAEAERLIGRIHAVLSKTIEKRAEIILESEAQLVQLVLQIAKKVVKVLSENQKNIVINNVLQALKKLKTRSDITIRVNLHDLNIVTEHAKEVVQMFEKIKNVTVLEDSTVDPGGCIIETDFGQIDARISSQLREIEEKILELMPIQDRAKPGGAG
jgi:flagellar assembly protein FliH